MASNRNTPCPCGSGKKYKHCCLFAKQNVSPPVEKVGEKVGHSGTVEKVVDWLLARHRKAVSTAFEEIVDEILDPQDIDGYAELEREARICLQINLTECLLAEGDILVHGNKRRVSEYVLGPSGPSLTAAQRDWLGQLAQRPLRLYDVTEVVPGVQMTLCDSVDHELAPITVRERTATRALFPGGRIATRVVRSGDHFELSGAAYNFSMLAGQVIGSVLQALNKEFGRREFAHPHDLEKLNARILMKAWLKQFVAPALLPTLMDAYSGEAILLVTDYYRVLDWQALSSALAACTDVFGDREEGWDRLIDCADGQTRPIAKIGLGKQGDQIVVHYKTQGYADKGRSWFDAVAQESVAFELRDVQDPKGIIPSNNPSTPPKSNPAMDPAMMAQAIEEATHRAYANWADQPLPMLGNKTPREAMQSPAGLERVKGLLRSYEANEVKQAAQLGRAKVSYDFLWQSVGLAR